MSYLKIGSVVFAFFGFLSCSPKVVNSNSVDHTEVISVTALINQKKELHGRQVRVVGYLDSHFEGSSLRAKREGDSVSVQIPNYGGCPVVLKNGRIVDSPDNLGWKRMPVLIVGRFWTTDLEYRGLVTKNVAVIESNAIVSIPLVEAEKLLKAEKAEKLTPHR